MKDFKCELDELKIIYKNAEGKVKTDILDAYAEKWLPLHNVVLQEDVTDEHRELAKAFIEEEKEWDEELAEEIVEVLQIENTFGVELMAK